jgi:hypothetical protein
MNIHPLWFLCLSVRLFMIYIIWYLLNTPRITNTLTKKRIKKICIIILFIIGLGFVRQGYFGSNNEVQIAKVFWHETRYIHGTIYLLSALYLLSNNLNVCLLLLGIDIIFSILYRIIFNK